METISEVLKRKRNTALIFRISIISVLAILIIVFTFFDEQASKAVYMGENAFLVGFAYLFYAIGYLPAILVEAVLFACCYNIVKSKGLKALFAFLTYSAVCGAVFTIFLIFDDVSLTVILPVACGAALVGTPALIFGASRLKTGTLREVFYVLLIGAVMATLMIVVLAPLQQFWGRDRYFSVLSGSGNYTAWYLPQGLSGVIDNRSFPSMHAGSAFSMVVLMIIALRMNLPKWLRITLVSAAALILVCIPLSRVIMGWHYMTDVLFGLLIAYGTGELGLLLGDKIYRRKRPLA